MKIKNSTLIILLASLTLLPCLQAKKREKKLIGGGHCGQVYNTASITNNTDLTIKVAAMPASPWSPYSNSKIIKPKETKEFNLKNGGLRALDIKVKDNEEKPETLNYEVDNDDWCTDSSWEIRLDENGEFEVIKLNN
jgi:hypothetical protein